MVDVDRHFDQKFDVSSVHKPFIQYIQNQVCQLFDTVLYYIRFYIVGTVGCMHTIYI